MLKETFSKFTNQNDEGLERSVEKLLMKIEKMILSNKIELPPIDNTNSKSIKKDRFHKSSLTIDLETLMNKVKKGIYFTNSEFELIKSIPPPVVIDNKIHKGRKKLSSVPIKIDKMESSFKLPRIIKWDILTKSIYDLVKKNSDNGNSKEFQIPDKIKSVIIEEKEFQKLEEERSVKKENIRRLQERNGEASMPGKWRKEAYDKRQYEKLNDYVPTTTISEKEGEELKKQLKSSCNGYFGQAYDYDDFSFVEEWMVSFQGNNKSTLADKDIIRFQVENLVEVMCEKVQARICTEKGILEREPLNLGIHQKEVPVWGIDCYTRRMVELSIEERVKPVGLFKIENVRIFIERYLLPAINIQPLDLAYNMYYSAEYINKSCILNKFNILSKDLLDAYSTALLSAINDFGCDLFQIHPKGTGVICTNPEGIAPHVVISEYIGEMYPPYRWCERQDVIEQAQEKYNLKPILPDFYNILLERPRREKSGYGLIYVDASQKANMGSTVSHSCDANCSSAVVSRNGKLAIVLTTNRHVYPGEEITHNYYAITSSDSEWRAAICLCGMAGCKGSFLHYATEEDLQQVLHQNCGPLWRYSSLLKACYGHSVSKDNEIILKRHGMGDIALGGSPSLFMKKYAASNLGFLEFERKALPCKLLRPSKQGVESEYNYSTADADARNVMEQRLQSLVNCFSLTQTVLNKQPDEYKNLPPLKNINAIEAISRIHKLLGEIPKLILKYLINNNEDDKMIKIDSKKKHLKTNSMTNLTAKEIKDLKQKEKKEKRKIQDIIDKINDIIAIEPVTMTNIKEMCLEIRSNIMLISDFQTPLARLQLLSDLLVLWANTQNFSTCRDYCFVESDPISVVARDLGFNIPRSIINNKDKLMKKIDIKTVKVDSTLTSEKISPTISSSNSNSINIKIIKKKEYIILEKQQQQLAPYWRETFAQHNHSIEEEKMDLQVDMNDEMMVVEENIEETTEETTKKNDNLYFSPNDVVFVETKKYNPRLIFSQLMGWYNCGTDDKIVEPDLFGCVELPYFSSCFGPSLIDYGTKQRDILCKHIKDERAQTMAWPDSIKSCFSKIEEDDIDQFGNKLTPLYGSPMLDVCLGELDAVSNVLELLGISKVNKDKQLNNDSQLDSILPPEVPTAWVQCENISCRKWRRVAWYVDEEQLPDPWDCSMNYWDETHSSCHVPEVPLNLDQEITINYEATGKQEELKIGDWRDVWCKTNQYYYEATVVSFLNYKATKTTPAFVKAKFYFKGWDGFDENIRIDSDRIQPHNFYTNPSLLTLEEQEDWQDLNLAEKVQECTNEPDTPEKKKRKVVKKDNSKKEIIQTNSNLNKKENAKIENNIITKPKIKNKRKFNSSIIISDSNPAKKLYIGPKVINQPSVVSQKQILYCYCRKPANDKKYLSCKISNPRSRCNGWVHPKCLGLKDISEYENNNKDFICSDCINNMNNNIEKITRQNSIFLKLNKQISNEEFKKTNDENSCSSMIDEKEL